MTAQGLFQKYHLEKKSCSDWATLHRKLKGMSCLGEWFTAVKCYETSKSIIERGIGTVEEVNGREISTN